MQQVTKYGTSVTGDASKKWPRVSDMRVATWGTIMAHLTSLTVKLGQAKWALWRLVIHRAEEAVGAREGLLPSRQRSRLARALRVAI